MVMINGGGGEWGFVFDSVGQTKFGNLVGVDRHAHSNNIKGKNAINFTEVSIKKERERVVSSLSNSTIYIFQEKARELYEEE